MTSDTDAPPSQDGSYLSERAADAAAGATLDAVRGAVTDFIPARNWVRRLTGADAQAVNPVVDVTASVFESFGSWD